MKYLLLLFFFLSLTSPVFADTHQGSSTPTNTESSTIHSQGETNNVAGSTVHQGTETNNSQSDKTSVTPTIDPPTYNNPTSAPVVKKQLVPTATEAPIATSTPKETPTNVPTPTTLIPEPSPVQELGNTVMNLVNNVVTFLKNL